MGKAVWLTFVQLSHGQAVLAEQLLQLVDNRCTIVQRAKRVLCTSLSWLG